MGDRMSNEVTSYANWSQVPFAGSLPAVKDMSHLRIKTSGGNLVMPYNYLPFFVAPAADPQLGNRSAPTHERWAEDTYSGSIRLRWTAARPILAGVLNRVDEHGIPIYDIPRTREGHHPVLQGTMTKGPLRTLFAAITGSRLDVLPEDEPFSYRTAGERERRYYSRSPADLLPDGLQPPRVRDELSAVQRVFGVVMEGSSPFADKGLLEFGGLVCTNVSLPEKDATPAWTLAIQGQPKPGYARFTTGTKLRDRRKEAFFGSQDTLAGRRIWLHHEAPLKAPPVKGWSFEQAQKATLAGVEGRPYLAKLENDNELQVSQFGGWVPPGAVFEQTLRFKNLKELELGALLAVLDRPGYHHIGRAKGFGLGSVTVERVDTFVVDSAHRQEMLATLTPSGSRSLDSSTLHEFSESFRSWVRAHGGAQTLDAFAAAAHPYSLIRYPTLQEYVHLETGRDGSERRPSLPALAGRQ